MQARNPWSPTRPPTNRARTGNELARRMAAAANALRERMVTALEGTRPEPALRALYAACHTELVADLTPAQFADVLAQVAAYALFVARWTHTISRETLALGSVAPASSPALGARGMRQVIPAERYHGESCPFSRADLSRLDSSHPWLCRLLTVLAGDALTGEEMLAPLDTLAKLLAATDLAELFPESEDSRSESLIAFYEPFLRAYDPALRTRRGVYFTPELLVGYVVRSVDALLADELGVRGGLANARRLLVLDPACGTGALLAGILAYLRQPCASETGSASRQEPAGRSVRLAGCELLPVPYLIAHLVLPALRQDGDGAPHLRLVLGDALGDGDDGLRAWAAWGDAPDHARASEAARESRQISPERDGTVLVIVGNPPYSGHSANDGAATAGLMRGVDPLDGSPTGSYFALDGMPLVERNLKWLGNDYVKFIRAAQWQIERTGQGILAFVTSSGYLESPTFRAMRRSLMRSFDAIYLLDLHGDGKRAPGRPGPATGERDENLFAIQQGVAIGLFVRRPGTPGPMRDATVFYVELRGSRARKLTWLAAHDARTTPWTRLAPLAPLYSFTPRDTRLADEYERGWPLTALMPEHSLGLLSKRDALVVGFSPGEALGQVAAFADPERDDEECARLFGLPLRDRDGWDLARTRASLAGAVREEVVRPLLYRPFDTRFVYCDPALIARPNVRVLRHLAGQGGNVALVVGRQGAATGAASWDVAFATGQAADQNLFRRGGATVFPLYLHEFARGVRGNRVPNLDPAFVARLCSSLGKQWRSDGADDQGQLAQGGDRLRPEDVLAYSYAVLWAPSFRARYADFLKDDFPRVPLIANADLFRELCGLGGRLLALHVDGDCPSRRAGNVVGDGVQRVERVRYAPPEEPGGTGRVWLNARECIEGVSPAIWAFTVGGYRVAEKWLKDRVGRVLTGDEIAHYQALLATIAATLVAMDQVDAAIARHGGWPLALDRG